MSKSKTPQSVLDALNEARSALYAQQYDLILNCQRIQRSIDAALETGKEVDSFDAGLLSEAKSKLADTILAREILFSLPNLRTPPRRALTGPPLHTHTHTKNS